MLAAALATTHTWAVPLVLSPFQDIVTDAKLLHAPVWAESARLASDQQVSHLNAFEAGAGPRRVHGSCLPSLHRKL